MSRIDTSLQHLGMVILLSMTALQFQAQLRWYNALGVFVFVIVLFGRAIWLFFQAVRLAKSEQRT
jgi:hypothetical protein